MLSATAVVSLYRYDKTIHRIVLSATDNSRVPLLQCDVAGERTVQSCRQKQKGRTSCDLFLAPQTELPLTGKCHGVTKGWLRGTSSSNLWLWICCRQLPLPHCIATTKQFTGLFCLRQITAALRCCDAMLQVRELCRGADRNKKTAHRAIFFVGASNRARTCDTAVNSRVLCQLSYWGIFGFVSLYQVIEPVTGLKHSRLARLERFAILLVSSYSTDQLFVHRTVDPSRQLTAACSANRAIEAYSVLLLGIKEVQAFYV